MARPKKCTVDYFQHFVKSGKTMYVLEERYGNDGYAFWFKLLEILGDTENHFFDCRNPEDFAFLQAKTRCDEDKALKILDLLSSLSAIDKELWKNRIIWSQNFVNHLSHLYSHRKVETPVKPDLYTQKPRSTDVSAGRNTTQAGLLQTENRIV